MNYDEFDEVLDDALRLLFSGYDPQLCAERWPEHRHALQPLLRVAHNLLACADEPATGLDKAAVRRPPIAWDALLSDVPQPESENERPCPARATVGPERTQRAPARRRTSISADQPAQSRYH